MMFKLTYPRALDRIAGHEPNIGMTQTLTSNAPSDQQVHAPALLCQRLDVGSTLRQAQVRNFRLAVAKSQRQAHL